MSRSTLFIMSHDTCKRIIQPGRVRFGRMPRTARAPFASSFPSPCFRSGAGVRRGAASTVRGVKARARAKALQALLLGVECKKGPAFNATGLSVELVAGTGFEPVTFGL